MFYKHLIKVTLFLFLRLKYSINNFCYRMENIMANNSLCRVLSFCQGLEEVYLSHINLIDQTLELLAQCENLKHLCFEDANFITPDKCFVIFEHCRKLKKVYFFYCNIDYYLLVWLKKKNPNVHIRIKSGTYPDNKMSTVY